MADFCAVRDRGFNGRKIIDEGVNIALKMPRSMRFMRHHCHLIRHPELVSGWRVTVACYPETTRRHAELVSA